MLRLREARFVAAGLLGVLGVLGVATGVAAELLVVLGVGEELLGVATGVGVGGRGGWSWRRVLFLGIVGGGVFGYFVLRALLRASVSGVRFRVVLRRGLRRVRSLVEERRSLRGARRAAGRREAGRVGMGGLFLLLRMGRGVLLLRAC